MSALEADWVSLSDHLDAWVVYDDAAVDASVHGDEDAAETYSDMAASHRRRAHRAASRLGLADLFAAREYDAVTEAACRVYDLPMSDQLNDEWASSNPDYTHIYTPPRRGPRMICQHCAHDADDHDDDGVCEVDVCFCHAYTPEG